MLADKPNGEVWANQILWGCQNILGSTFRGTPKLNSKILGSVSENDTDPCYLTK